MIAGLGFPLDQDNPHGGCQFGGNRSARDAGTDHGYIEGFGQFGHTLRSRVPMQANNNFPIGKLIFLSENTMDVFDGLR
jgi:hypothetical protein